MRRTVATMLVVASPLLLATPVSANGDRLPGSNPAAATLAGPALRAPVVPAPVVAAPVLSPPTAPAPTVPALTVPAAPAPVRHAVGTVRARSAPAAADLSDSAYTARLQAELCHARQIFCGLDRNGRYPGS